MAGERQRPGLTSTFRQPLQGELRRIWVYLANVAIGPEWRLFNHADGLYLQKYSAEDRKYISKVLFKKDGDLDITGVQHDSQTLSDVGAS